MSPEEYAAVVQEVQRLLAVAIRQAEADLRRRLAQRLREMAGDVKSPVGPAHGAGVRLGLEAAAKAVEKEDFFRG